MTFLLSERIDLNQYEEKLLRIIRKNPGISDSKAGQIADLAKETTSKYLKTLQEYGLIEHQRVQRNEKAWFVSTGIFQSFENSRDGVIKDYEIMESKIIQSLKLVKNMSHNEIVSVYLSAFKKVFAFFDFVTFILASNSFGKHPKHWIDLQKRSGEFLNELVKNIDDDVYDAVVNELAKRDNMALDEINYFLKFHKIR